MQQQYIDLNLTQEELLADQKHLLAVYKVIPKEKERTVLDLASEVASESSSGSSLKIGTLTEFSKTCDAKVYKVDEENQLAFIAYPVKIFDRGGNVQNVMTFLMGNIYGMSDLSGLKLLDFYVPHEMQKDFKGPTYTLADMRYYLDVYGRPILGTIVKPKIGLKPNEFADVAYEFWSGGGDFVKFDEPQADQEFCPFEEVIYEIGDRLDRVKAETGKKKIISVNVSAADFDTMIKRADFVGGNLRYGSYAFLVDGITAGLTAVQTMARRYPDVFIHFHRAGHGAFTRKENPFGFTVPVLTKLARLAGASGVHTGTAGVGKMADDVYENIISLGQSLNVNADGYYFMEDWEDTNPITPIASGGLNPTKLAPLMDKFGTVDFITTMGGGVHSYPDGTRAGAKALVQACEAYQKGLSIDEYAKDHVELKRAIEKYRK